MEDKELIKRLDNLQERVDAAARSVDKLRLYFLWTVILALVTLILPVIGLLFAIPTFLQSMGSVGNFNL
ncbi:MAG: hypothetical protein PHT12_01625 [Patescibacteria group bacterium]|nr:hypothetical protein [Patescibacteria group bacterium]